jgi:hypothetical protein
VNRLAILKQGKKRILSDKIQMINQLEEKSDIKNQNQEKAGQKEISRENQSIVKGNSSSEEGNKKY